MVAPDLAYNLYVCIYTPRIRLCHTKLFLDSRITAADTFFRVYMFIECVRPRRVSIRKPFAFFFFLFIRFSAVSSVNPRAGSKHNRRTLVRRAERLRCRTTTASQF